MESARSADPSVRSIRVSALKMSTRCNKLQASYLGPWRSKASARRNCRLVRVLHFCENWAPRTMSQGGNRGVFCSFWMICSATVFLQVLCFEPFDDPCTQYFLHTAIFSADWAISFVLHGQLTVKSWGSMWLPFRVNSWTMISKTDYFQVHKWTVVSVCQC